MRKSIFMYLFFFAVLFVIFQFMNEQRIYEKQEKEIESLTNQLQKANDSLASANDRIEDLNYFGLRGNDNAMTYLENYRLDPEKVEQEVTNRIYDTKNDAGENPLIQFKGDIGTMRINKIKFLNHKWVIADFSDGDRWGEMIIEFQYNENNELALYPLGSLLYPKGY